MENLHQRFHHIDQNYNGEHGEEQEHHKCRTVLVDIMPSRSSESITNWKTISQHPHHTRGIQSYHHRWSQDSCLLPCTSKTPLTVSILNKEVTLSSQNPQGDRSTPPMSTHLSTIANDVTNVLLIERHAMTLEL